jgi:hypothetical protein
MLKKDDTDGLGMRFMKDVFNYTYIDGKTCYEKTVRVIADCLSNPKATRYDRLRLDSMTRLLTAACPAPKTEMTGTTGKIIIQTKADEEQLL